MNDQELTSTPWDADHRLAAITTLASGLLVIIGTALFFTLGMGPAEALVSGQAAGPMAVTMLGGLLLIVDVRPSWSSVALAHTFSEGRSIGLTVTTGVATLATASAAAIHLVWVNLASNLGDDGGAGAGHRVRHVARPERVALPLFALVGPHPRPACSLGPLRRPLPAVSRARAAPTASAVIGGLLVALAPFSGYSPDQSALVTAAVITSRQSGSACSWCGLSGSCCWGPGPGSPPRRAGTLQA